MPSTDLSAKTFLQQFWFGGKEKATQTNQTPIDQGNYFQQSERTKQHLLRILQRGKTLLDSLDHETRIALDKTARTALHELALQVEQTVFRVGVFGSMKTGKSTLINRLLNEPILLPVDEDRCTAVYTLIEQANSQHPAGFVLIEWQDLTTLYALLQDCLKQFHGMKLPTAPNSSQYLSWFKKSRYLALLKKHRAEFETMAKWLADLDDDTSDDPVWRFNKQKAEALLLALPRYGEYQDRFNTVRVEQLDTLMHDKLAPHLISKLTLYYQHDLLRHIRIIDSPGVGSATLQDTEIAKRLLAESDAILFMTDARTPFSYQDEVRLLQLLGKLQAQSNLSNVFVVANKIDLSQKSQSAIHETVNRQIEKLLPKHLKPRQIYCVSCKTADNFDVFFKDFVQFLQRDKYQVLLSSALNRTSHAITTCVDTLDQQIQKKDQSIVNTKDQIHFLETGKQKLTKKIDLWLSFYEPAFSKSMAGSALLIDTIFQQEAYSLISKMIDAITTSDDETVLAGQISQIYEAYLLEVMNEASRQISETFRAKIQEMDRQIQEMFWDESATTFMVDRKTIYSRLKDISVFFNAGSMQFDTAVDIDLTSYLTATVTSSVIAIISLLLLSPWLAVPIIIGSLFGFGVFKKSPDKVAASILKELEKIFYEGALVNGVQRPPIRKTLHEAMLKRFRDELNQITRLRKQELNSLVNDLEKRLKKQHQQRAADEKRRDDLSRQKSSLKKEFERLRQELNKLQRSAL